MKTKKVVRMPLRRTPASKKGRSPAKQRARAATAPAREEDYDYGEEPNMRFSHALIVVLILHLIAVGGVFAFNWMKANQGKEVRTSAVATAAGEEVAPVVTTKDSAPGGDTKATAGWGGRTHTVAAGDTLTRVAANYGVTIAAIEKVNGINDYSMIRVGQVLKIPPRTPAPTTAKTEAPASQPVARSASSPSAASTPTGKQKAFLATQPVTKKAVIAAVPTNRIASGEAAKPKPAAAAPTTETVIYEVVKGDNPYSIARKFKVNYNKLIEINGITDPTKIQIGQKLKIPPQ